MSPWVLLAILLVASSVLLWYYRSRAKDAEGVRSDLQDALKRAKASELIARAGRVAAERSRSAAEVDRNAALEKMWHERADKARKVKDPNEAVASLDAALRRSGGGVHPEGGASGGAGGTDAVPPPEVARGAAGNDRTD